MRYRLAPVFKEVRIGEGESEEGGIQLIKGGRFHMIEGTRQILKVGNT